MSNDEKLKSLQEENKALKEMLKETLVAMCDYRTIKGHCAQCKTFPYCLARKTIPKVEQILKGKSKSNSHLNEEKGENK